MKKGDFVYIKDGRVQGIFKIIKDFNELQPIMTTIEDSMGRKLEIGYNELIPVNMAFFMRSNCPECGTAWKLSHDGVNEKKFCDKCKEDSEEIIKRARRRIIYDKST